MGSASISHPHLRRCGGRKNKTPPASRFSEETAMTPAARDRVVVTQNMYFTLADNIDGLVSPVAPTAVRLLLFWPTLP